MDNSLLAVRDINHKYIVVGGEGFTESQLKELSRVKVFDKSGKELTAEEIVFSDPDQLTSLNKAKTAGETGNFSLTFQTAKGTEITITVHLRDHGTDGAKNPENLMPPSLPTMRFIILGVLLLPRKI